MRVIAGCARGTRLKAPKGMQVRPTADRVKEALFNILGANVPGSFFIDLYAGSGAVGIEALSRGAEYCIFIDNYAESIAAIKYNLSKTRLLAAAEIIRGDVLKTIVKLSLEKISADIIFLDPPYLSGNLLPIASQILNGPLLRNKGLLVVEHAAVGREQINSLPGVRQKRYGDTCLSLIGKV